MAALAPAAIKPAPSSPAPSAAPEPEHTDATAPTTIAAVLRTFAIVGIRFFLGGCWQYLVWCRWLAARRRPLCQGVPRKTNPSAVLSDAEHPCFAFLNKRTHSNVRTECPHFVRIINGPNLPLLVRTLAVRPPLKFCSWGSLTPSPPVSPLVPLGTRRPVLGAGVLPCHAVVHPAAAEIVTHLVLGAVDAPTFVALGIRRLVSVEVAVFQRGAESRVRE